MPLITITITETDAVFVTASQSVATSTTQIAVTLPAAPGQTITLLPLPASPIPVAPYTPSPQSILTLTATELDVFVEGPSGDIWTTLTVEVAPNTSPSLSLSGTTYVLRPERGGWNAWSEAQKGGCIAGAVLGALLLLGLIWCLRRRKKIWYTVNTNRAMYGPQMPVTQPHAGWGRWIQ